MPRPFTTSELHHAQAMARLAHTLNGEHTATGALSTTTRLIGETLNADCGRTYLAALGQDQETIAEQTSWHRPGTPPTTSPPAPQLTDIAHDDGV